MTVCHIWDLSSSVIMWHRVTGLCHFSNLADDTAMTRSVCHQLPSDATSHPNRTATSTVQVRRPLNSDTSLLRRLVFVVSVVGEQILVVPYKKRCRLHYRLLFVIQRWCSWLRHCATSRKVAGSIPDCIAGVFRWYNPSGRTMAQGLTQPITEMSTRKNSWGGKGGWCVGLTTLQTSYAVCVKIWDTQRDGLS
jgi:hypothetical protein